MADYSKLTKRELIMTLYARDLMLENERKRLEYLTEKYFELKQQLHDLPKKIVEDIKNYKGCYFDWKIGEKIFPAFKITEEDLDAILEKFGGEDEINND